jgi:glyoxylase-like metal-dependent hydrolase (beta-lactamase superfamily II)
MLGRLRTLGERTWVLTGSPNTLLIDIDDGVLVIDPGIGDGRAEEISGALERMNKKLKAVLLTHGHTDHLAAAPEIVSKEVKVLAHRLCVGLVESLELRFNLVYGGVVSRGLASMPPVRLRVTEVLEWGAEPFPGIKTIDLHGHTPGHTGVVIEEDRVVAAADAVLGERVLKRFGIPFSADLKAWTQSLEVLKEYAEEGYKIVPGHGPIAEGKRAVAMIEENVEVATRVYEYVYKVLKEKGPLSLERLAVLATRELSQAELTPRQVLLNRTTLVSVVKWLEEDGRVEPEVSEEGVVWRAKD